MPRAALRVTLVLYYYLQYRAVKGEEMLTTGLSGWCKPDAGFACGRGGGSSQLGLPLVSGGSSRTGDRIGADPKIHTYRRTGVTGQQYPSVDGPAYRPPSDFTSLPIVQQLTTVDYSSIHEKRRQWANDSTGAFTMLEAGAPRQPPISTRIVDQFASAREPGVVRGPTGQVLRDPRRAASCEPVLPTCAERPQTSPQKELQRRLGEWASKADLGAKTHEATQLDIPPAPTNASPRRHGSPYGRISTLRPKPRKQLPSLDEAKADREARRQFNRDMNEQRAAFTYTPRREQDTWEKRCDQVKAQITARAVEPFTALGREAQQTLSTAARLSEPSGALFSLDAERAVVLARGIGLLDVQYGCGGQLPRCVRRMWSGHGTSALQAHRFADLDINDDCRRLVRHLLTAVEQIYPGRASGEHMPLTAPNPVARRAPAGSHQSSGEATAARAPDRRPQTQASVRPKDLVQRNRPLEIPMQHLHYPLVLHPRPQLQEHDIYGDEDEQELRELAAGDLGASRPQSRSSSPTQFGPERRSSSPTPQQVAGAGGPATPLQAGASAGRYITSPVFETPSDVGGRLSPGREDFLENGTAGVEPILIGGGKFPSGRPDFPAMLAAEREARLRVEQRAAQSIAAAQAKMLAMESQVAALRSELRSQQDRW